MTLSNCQFCIHLSDLSCAKNPAYHGAFSIVQGQIEKGDQDTISTLLAPCEYWHKDPSTTLQNGSISMSVSAWESLLKLALPEDVQQRLAPLLLVAEDIVSGQAELADDEPGTSQIELPPVPISSNHGQSLDGQEDPGTLTSPSTDRESMATTLKLSQEPLEKVVSLETFGEFWEESPSTAPLCSEIRRGSGRITPN